MSEPSERVCPACQVTWNGLDVCPNDGARLVVVAPDPLIGAVLDQRYLVVSPLGAGGMGLVYSARQLSVDREVALKVVAPERVRDPEMVRRFLREARLASRILHPNTVTVFDSGQDPSGRLFIAMELVAGRTLADVLRADGPLDPMRTLRIGVQICDALDAAQRQNVIHRDLKPANIIVCDHPAGRDHIKVLDFGLARSLGSDGDDSTITREGVVCGTPAYISPEAACADETDVRSDLYSLGVMLYEMVEGRLPFAGGTNAQVLARHVTAEPPSPLRAPPALARVILRLLEKLPSDRYATPSAVRSALDAAAEDLRHDPAPAGRPGLVGDPTVDAPIVPRTSVATTLSGPHSSGASSPSLLSPGTAAAELRRTDVSEESRTAAPRTEANATVRGRWLGLLVVAVAVAVVVGWMWTSKDATVPPAVTPTAPPSPAPAVPVAAAAPSRTPAQPALLAPAPTLAPGAMTPAPDAPSPSGRAIEEAERRASQELAQNPEQIRVRLDSSQAVVTALGLDVPSPGTLTLPYGTDPVPLRFRFGKRVVTHEVVPDRDQTVTVRLPRRDAAPDFITSP